MRIVKMIGAGILLAAALVVVPAQSAHAVEDFCMGQPATHKGTDGPDYLVGTDGNDVFTAGQGEDIIVGLGGDDVICGGQGNDRLYGGDGVDVGNGGGGWDICDVEVRINCES